MVLWQRARLRLSSLHCGWRRLRRVQRDAEQREAEYALLRPFVARRLLESAGWDFGRVERHVRERRLMESPAFDVLLAGGYCSISGDDEDVGAGWCEWFDEVEGAGVSWVDVRGRARVEGGVVTYSAWRPRMSSLAQTYVACLAASAPVVEESRTGRARGARGGAGGSAAGRRRRRAEALGEGGSGDDGGDDSDDGLDELVGALGP